MMRKRQVPREYGGLIAFWQLEDWWRSLSEDERNFIRECYAKSLVLGGPPRKPEELDDPAADPQGTTQTASSFLSAYSTWAIGAKRYDLAFNMLMEALKRADNPIDAHFAYNHLIDLCYRRRDEGEQWIEKCIEYCKADIDAVEEFLGAYLQKFGPPTPRIPSFERLAIIYERQGKFKEAIDVCRKALEYKLHDGTKGGFESRIRRLEKKLGA